MHTRSVYKFDHLNHECSTRGPSGCYWRPAVLYVYTINLHNNLGGLVYHLLLFFCVQVANQPTKSGVAL
jgi:hypothetical protein